MIRLLNWDIQNINDMPNISRQIKIATRNFGDTDPLSIDHYIARGGYSALSSAIFEKTPEFIVDEVKNSGLRVGEEQLSCWCKMEFSSSI